jgi:hypothetical protein
LRLRRCGRSKLFPGKMSWSWRRHHSAVNELRSPAVWTSAKLPNSASLKI